DASAHGGFTTGDPWISVNPNYPEINAADQVDDPDSVLHHYRRLIELRHEWVVVREGEFRLLSPDHEQIFAYLRLGESDDLLVVANLSSQEAEAELPEPDGWDQVLLSNFPDPRRPGQVFRPW